LLTSLSLYCAAIYQFLLHMVFTSHSWFIMQGPVAIILISWNVIFIWETGYWTRAMKRFALFDLLKSLYSFLTFLLTSLSLYIFTIWKCIVYHRLCRDGIYFDKILVSEYKLFKRSNKANLSVVNSVLKFRINGTTSILKSFIFQTCAATYQLLLYMMLTSIDRYNVIKIPVCEIKGSSLMNLLIFYQLLKNLRLIWV
jgi:hypothetical protein